MEKLAELQSKKADLKAALTALVDKVEARDGEFTAEEQAEYDAKMEEVKALDAKIKAAEELAAKRRAADGITVGESTPRPAGQNAVNEEDPALTGGFKGIDEFATAVFGAVKARNMGGTIDDRLVGLSNTHEGGTSDGEGYSLPPQYRDQVWELVNVFDEFGSMIDEEPTSAREVRMGADETTPWGSAGIKAYWRAEGDQMDRTKMLAEGRRVPLHELYVLATVEEDLLEDAPRLANRLTRKAAMAIAWKKNLSIVEGTGVGQPLGWKNSPAMLTIPAEGGQTADTINALNCLNMLSRLHTIPGDTPFWMTNRDTLPQLATMTIGDKPVWLPPSGDLSGAPGGFLLGYPVRFSEFAEPLGDAGDLQLISPMGWYGARRASGPKFATSIHLFFDYNTQAFRWVFRYGGQPHLTAPVAPFKGSGTRSHFLQLAERA